MMYDCLLLLLLLITLGGFGDIVYAGGNMDAGAILNKVEQLKGAEDLGKSM